MNDAPSRRRSFLSTAGRGAMAVGLLLGYGTFATIAGRFLYPTAALPKVWQYVASIGSWRMGEAQRYTTPSGATAVIARRGNAGSEDDFVALSDKCPHLGCRVHWDAGDGHFICPCHNGSFDADGAPTGGPPLKDETPLPRFRLQVVENALFIEVAAPIET